jgi:hypothetical protein
LLSREIRQKNIYQCLSAPAVAFRIGACGKKEKCSQKQSCAKITAHNIFLTQKTCGQTQSLEKLTAKNVKKRREALKRYFSMRP